MLDNENFSLNVNVRDRTSPNIACIFLVEWPGAFPEMKDGIIHQVDRYCVLFA